MFETEITVQVFDDLENVRQKLEKQGFELLEEYVMLDYYYSRFANSELSKMSYKDLIANSFLLRDIRDANPKKHLCYKNKIIDEKGSVVSEEKIFTKLDNIDNAKLVFEKANINKWCEMKTTLYVYQKQNVQFALQFVDDLGLFLEYEEDETMQHMTQQEKRDFMSSTLNSLGLKSGADFSCKKIFMKFRREGKFC